jgi:hypothetical protein
MASTRVQRFRQAMKNLAVATIAALVFVPTAAAAAPILLSVGDISRHPTATWSLPSGVESRVAEVATSPQTSSDGYFFNENVKAFDTLEPTQTSWAYNSQLDPGTYYVHIGGFDTTCSSCPIREWSEIKTLIIAAPPPPPPPIRKVYAPDCRGRPHFKPRAIVVACGDGNLSLLRLHWSRWTSQAASGVGIYHWNDCIPMCYRGHFHSRAGARVKLYRVTRCRSKGFLQFTRMRVTPPPSLPRFKAFMQKLSCTYR